MKTASIVLLLAALPAAAQEYQVANSYIMQNLSVENGHFRANSVSFRGNLCDVEGKIVNNEFRDGEGCVVRFKFDAKGVSVGIDDSARQACQNYCGMNAYFDGDYVKLPAACTDKAQQQTEQRFQAAYRSKQFGRAVQIRQQQLAQCEPFLYYTSLMRVRNDLAVAHKNNGNKAACRQALQPLAAEINGSSDFVPAYIMKDAYDMELKHARFNWAACR